jgi:signal transduction histidine kinase
MTSAPRPFPHPGSRFAIIGIAIAGAIVLGGLYAADHALKEADRTRSQLDALESATQVETFFAVRTSDLNAFHLLYTDASGAPQSPAPGGDVAPVTGPLARPLRHFRSVWLADSGAVVRQVYGSDTAARVMIGADLDTMRARGVDLLARQARASGEAQVSAPGELPGVQRGVVLLQPVIVADRVAGFVSGVVVADTIARTLPGTQRDERVWLTIRAGEDTVVSRTFASYRGEASRGKAYIRLPGGASWAVDVGHAPVGQTLRWSLFLAAITALGAVTLGVLHERRQVQRIADRSRELEHLSTELIRVNRAKSEFLANVSHELRTPLNAIVGFVDLLKDGVYGELAPRQVGPVGRIAASATHLRQLVDQILDLAKMAAGRLEVHPELVDLRPFVFDVATEVEPLVNEKGLTLSLGVGATLPRVRTDPTHLRQILVNLLANAVKFTPSGAIAVRGTFVERSAAEAVAAGTTSRATAAAGGQVRTAARVALAEAAPSPDRHWVALQVSDTGVGIAPTDLERIFDEFEQLGAGARAGDSAQRGTGLGLSISRRLARLLGGDLTVESVVGKGSTFTLWLKVDDGDVRT